MDIWKSQTSGRVSSSYLSAPTGSKLEVGKEVLSEGSDIWARLENARILLQNVPFATSYSQVQDCTRMLKHYWILLLTEFSLTILC